MAYALHAHWRPANSPAQSGAILFWAEAPPESGANRGSPRDHPFCAGADALRDLLGREFGDEQAPIETFTLRLPSSTRRPLPSPQLGTGDGRNTKSPALRPWGITGLRLEPVAATEVLLEWLDDEYARSGVRLGASVVYWRRAAQLALEALARHRLIPGLKRLDDALYARWLPLVGGHRVAGLAEAMPPICRASAAPLAKPAVEDAPAPEALLRDFLEQTCDALARAWAPAPESLRDVSALDASRSGSEPGLRWARALFGPPRPIAASEAQRDSLARSHRLWLRNLEVAGDEHFRVALRLSEPEPAPDGNPDGSPDGKEGAWSVAFFLQARDDPSLLVGAADVWRGGEAIAGLRRLKNPQEKLLAGLGHAARFFTPLQRALRESSTPEGLKLTTGEAFRFMRECAPLLEEGGFGVLIPPWWNRSSARLRLRPRLSPTSGADTDGVAQGMMGLDLLLNYRWELSLGE